ncbi:MAG: ABC transporter ATP-binding protein [Candidatus Schekmanbacteria bacterium]|nr:ABC transporter ATP-binding protein [Candidatus Schekmanbacteria bacterium]
MAASDYAILIEGVTKRYPVIKRYREMLRHPFKRQEVTALAGVDLTVQKGELFGLLGVNGAGKTTLIKILCTLVYPNEGRALVNGYDTVRESWDVRCSVGYVISDERSFYWRLTGRQNLEFFAVLYNLNKTQAKQRVDSLLDLVGLTKAAGKMFKDYSTGMRQKMAILRGLLIDPAVLFMDEPTRSLDPAAAHHLREFVINEIVQKQGRTVFFSTHNLQEAEMCHHIAILDQGKIKLCGTPVQIREQYSRPRYWLQLQSYANHLQELLSAYPGMTHVQAADKPGGLGKGWEVELASSDGAINDLLAYLMQKQVSIEACYPQKASLEEIFQHLTLKNDPT